jgi:hypothetical protein
MAALGAAMRAGLAVLIVIVISLPELARSQTNTDTDTALTIAIHPEVSTILQLPDEIMHTWIDHHGEIRIARMGNELAIRPRAGTPAGVEASLDVETRTIRRTFRLRVVERARDASRDVLIVPIEGEQDPEESAPEAPPVEPVTPAEPATPAMDEPVTGAPADAPSPAPPEPLAGPEPAGKPVEPTIAPVPTATPFPRLELFVHAIGGLGFTGLHVAGYTPRTALRSHGALGMRLTGKRPDASWALEATVSGEWPSGPMEYGENSDRQPRLVVSGPLLRAETGLSMRLGTKWIPWGYAGIGVQVQLRRTEATDAGGVSGRPVTEMKPGGVLGLGMGLQYRAGDVLLGLEFHGRYGGPDGYGSITTFWTVGYFLDQGE